MRLSLLTDDMRFLWNKLFIGNNIALLFCNYGRNIITQYQ